MHCPARNIAWYSMYNDAAAIETTSTNSFSEAQR
jgi:hypothetical protein